MVYVILSPSNCISLNFFFFLLFVSWPHFYILYTFFSPTILSSCPFQFILIVLGSCLSWRLVAKLLRIKILFCLLISFFRMNGGMHPYWEKIIKKIWEWSNLELLQYFWKWYYRKVDLGRRSKHKRYKKLVNTSYWKDTNN